MAWILAGTRLRLPSVLSRTGVTQDMLDSPTPCVKRFLPGEALLSPEVQSSYWRQFIGTYFSTYKNFRLPNGKQGFIINHDVCAHSLGTLISLGMLGTISKTKLPDASQELTLQADLSMDSSLRPAMVTISYTSSIYKT